MKHISFLPVFAAFIAVLPAGAETAAPGFDLAGTLRDKTGITGTIDQERFEFAATTGSGEDIRVEIARNPSWAVSDVVLEISWCARRERYVLRTFNWTGEAVRLRGVLAARSGDRRIDIRVDSIEAVVVTQRPAGK